MTDRGQIVALLVRLDNVSEQIAEIRAAAAAMIAIPSQGNASGPVIDVKTAANRLGLRPDSLRKILRNHPECGEREGGRWMVRLSEAQRRVRRF